MKNLNFFKSYLTRLRGLAALTLMLFAIGIGNVWGLTNTYTKVTAVTDLSDNDLVVLATESSSNPSTGVSGQNGTNDAAVSDTESDWVQYKVTLVKSGSTVTGWTLYNSTLKQYIQSPTGNHFKHGNTGGTCSVKTSSGGQYTFTCNSRYLQKNGNYYRMYTSINNSYTPFYVWKVETSCANKVTLTKGSETNGTFTLDQTNGEHDNCDANFVVHVSNVVPADNTKYCSGINVTGGNSSVTGPVDGVWTVTYTKGNTITSTITPTYSAKTAASISFVNAGSPAPSTSGYVGDTYVLPSTNNTSCNGKTFVGWSTVEVAETNTKPSSNFYEPGGSVTLVASQTFYAVFATGSGASWATASLASLTSSDIFVIAAGNYAIPNDEGTSSSPDATSITVSNNEITSVVADKLKWNISGNATDGYTFYPNGSTTTWLYCSTTASSSSNDNIRVGTGDRKVWKPNNTGYLVTNDNYTARYLSIYSTTDFRSYVSTSNGAFVPTIYKYTSDYSNYSTSCVAPSSFNVTYNANGDGAGNATGTTGSVPTDNTDYSSGATVTVLGKNTLAKEGYTFTGWNTAANGSGTSYAEGATFSITANTTLYAQWSIKKYTVTWHVGETTGTTTNVNHGTLYSAIASDAGQPAHGDGALELCGSTKFIGWVKASGAYTGDGKTVDWYDTHKVSASDEITSNTDYYAMYAEADGDASYQLVTSDLGSDWAGKYLIAYSSSIFADGRNSGESGIGVKDGSVDPTATYLSGTTVALSWGDTYYVTLEEISAGSNTYLLKTQDGYYNYRTANSNGIHTSNNRSTADDYPLTITYNSSSDIDIAAPAGAQFHYNTDGYFRFYKDAGQQNVHLYKRVENLINYRTGCTISCGRPSSPTSTSVTANSATIGWTGGGNGTLSRYEYAYWVDGDTEPTSGFTSAGTSTSANLTNLYAGVKYNWKVRKVCTGSDGESAWLKSDFTTTEVDLTFSVPTGVDAVDGQKSNVALPSANVPTGCGCWSFAGWTTASYATSSDAPAALFLPGAKARVKANAVLYAVYQKSAYRIISRLADIEEDEYYVFTLNDFGVDGAMTSNASGTYYTSSEEVSIKEDEIGKYIENPSSSAIWQFSGTTSAGLFMNIESRKYIDLSSTSSPVATTTTDNLTITVNDESEKQFDIRSNTTTTNYLQAYSDNQWGVDNDHDGYFSARIFKRAESSYSSAPSCPTYTVTFDKNGGTTHDTKYVTACDGYLSELPTAPAENTLNCATRFVGWSAEELTGAGHNEPEDLFSSVVYSPQITDNTTFYAVFASGALLYNDVLTRETTGVPDQTGSSASYSDWSDKTGSSGAKYAGNSAGDHNAIQLRTNNNNSGIVTTTSGGKARKVTVEWEANTTSGRSIDIYGKNTAYTAASDLYGDDKGTLLGSIDYDTETELTIDGSYTYIGIRSNSSALYLTSVTIQWDDCNYSDYMTYCTNVYNDATNDHNWSTTGNWSNGHVPTINERATINKPVTVDVTDAKAKNVILNQNGNTGKLTIQANKALEVAGTVTRTTDGSNSLPTRPEDLILESSSAGNATLIFDNSNSDQATVYLYSKGYTNKIIGDGGVWNWQFIGVPVTNATRLSDYYDGYMYEWDNSIPGWVDKTDFDATLTPFTAYSVSYPTTSDNLHTYEIDGTLVATTNKTIDIAAGKTVQAAANSWTAPIRINDITSTNWLPANIFIYNTGYNYEDDYATQADARYAAGTYLCIPVSSAPYLGESYIASMQGFLIKNTKSDKAGTITLNYGSAVRTDGSTGIEVGAMHAPARTKQKDESAPVVMKIYVSDTEHDDRVVLLEREDFSRGFDNGWDGEKFQVNAVKTAPRLFAINETGGKEAVSAIPEIEGTVIGFRPGTEAMYTIKFDYEGSETYYLLDTKTGFSTLICKTCEYEFSSNGENEDARFIIAKSPATATGIDNSTAGSANVYKMVLDDHIYIIRNGKMYDVTGILCK